MKQAQIPQADDDCDPILKANFTHLMGDMSVGGLRGDMGDIGTSAIQSAKKGSKGMRLETLEKFAAYFKVQPYQLLLPDLGMREPGLWPFSLITPDQLSSLPPEHLATVEKVALDLLGSVRPADTDPSKKGQSLRFELTTKRKHGSGNSDRAKAPPRKSSGG